MNIPETTIKQREIILHSLGVSSRTKKPYRSHYCVASGDTELEKMVEIGVMQHGRTINEGRDMYYLVTELGAAAVGHKLPKD